jgi:ankyrin repeat protein
MSFTPYELIKSLGAEEIFVKQRDEYAGMTLFQRTLRDMADDTECARTIHHMFSAVPSKEMCAHFANQENFLYHALRVGKVHTAEELLKNGANPNPKMDWTHGSLLNVFCGNHPMLHLLLRYGANPNIYDAETEEETKKCGLTSPLTRACMNEDLVAVEMLLNHGADPNACTTGNLCWSMYKEGCPLFAAVHTNNLALVRLLIEGAGANPNVRVPQLPEISALWIARQQGQPAMFQYLLKAGATVSEDFIKETFDKPNMRTKWEPIAALLRELYQ